MRAKNSILQGQRQPFEPFNTDKLFSICREEAVALCQSLVHTHGDDMIYAASLCVDSDVSTVFPAVNSPGRLRELTERQERSDAQHRARLHDLMQRAGRDPFKIPDRREQRADATKWYPGDWVSQLDRSVQFPNTNAALAGARGRPGETREEFLARKTTKVETLTRALAAARDECLPRADVTVFVCIMDAEAGELKIMLDAAAGFNTPENHAALVRGLR